MSPLFAYILGVLTPFVVMIIAVIYQAVFGDDEIDDI